LDDEWSEFGEEPNSLWFCLTEFWETI